MLASRLFYAKVGGMLLVLLLLLPTHIRAQDVVPSPLSNFVLAGYGSATYEADLSDDFSNNFSASVSPVLLYEMSGSVLFETELEFGLSGDRTTTALEYAQVDYLGFERVQVIAGKFLLPFGFFSERLHPTWINKMPSAPLLYGHAHGGVAEEALLPMLSDAGALVRFKQPMTTAWALDLSLWISQGPRLITEEGTGDDHAATEPAHQHAAVPGTPITLNEGHDESSSTGSALDLPQVGFGVAFGDNNKNKMLGGRIGVVHGPGFEAAISGFHAMYDPDNFLDITGGNLAIEMRWNGLDLRGESIFLWQEFQHEGGYETLRREGYYLQVARRLGAFEPIMRWSHLPEATVDGVLAAPSQKELALGLTYWIDASIPVKLAYEWHPDGTDGLAVQWAYGF